MLIGDALREAREREGLSQRSLAARAGVDHAAVSRYETGAKIPRTDTLQTLAAALGLQVELRPARSPHQRFVDALCRLQADAVVADPSLLDEARHRLEEMVGRSVWTEQWRRLLAARVEAVVGVLTSTSPQVDALKADSPLALVVVVEPDVRRRLLEVTRAS